MAPNLGMIVRTVIAVKVRSWIGAPTLCNLLPIDSFAGIGVLRNGYPEYPRFTYLEVLYLCTMPGICH